MPAATTLNLPEILKARIAPLAGAAGKSPHAWMLDALEAQATLAEARAGFVAAALEAETEMEASGVAWAMEDVHAWLRARQDNPDAPLPPALPPEAWRG